MTTPTAPLDSALAVARALRHARQADTLLDAVTDETRDEMPDDAREHLVLARAAAANARRHLTALAAAYPPDGIDDYYLGDDEKSP